jgi:GH24 family phage-related lysozyme (muramidase)
MAPNNPTKELIDERIVRLLGLSYEFELDYQTYSFYLKEKLVEVTSSRKKIPPEEFDLIKNEFKRVRGKTGRFTFKIKKNRINANNVSNLNNFSKKNKILLPGTQVSKDQAKQSVVGEGILDIVKSIGKTVISIHKTLLTQSNLSKKEFEIDRKNEERSRRGSREDKLEQKENGVIETAKKILAPFQSIFDRIIRFLVFTILGRAFKVFMDWAGDPKNKGKLTTIGKFLKDWWPALLGAWFLFATPLGAFTRTIIGTIAKLSFHLAKFAIPKLIKFAATNPVITAGAVTGVAAGAGFMMEKNRTDDIAKRQGTVPEKRGQGNWFNEIGKAFNPGQLGMGGVSPMSRGGSVFSGVVDKDTGETVSGAGSDTQFLPIEGGGGAVLQRGESVLQVGARERMIRQAGVDPLAYNIGSNANKPRKINPRNLIGLSGGGEIGTATHHLKQDEALSSLTPGINDFTRPGSSKWSKLTTNTPIHSYIDSVGKPTIGWGSTYYDSILNGKKPVKSGDKITKGKADNILSTNVSNLSKEYSTKIPHWNKMSNNQRAGLLVLGYNAPNGPIGAYPKLTNALQQGDIKSAAQNLQRGGPNAARIALERSLLMSGPLNLKNLVGPKIVGEKKVGSGIPGIPPFLYTGKKGGGALGPNGKVLTNTGDKNPHSASDPRVATVALHPDEYVKVFTKDFADRGGMEVVGYLQAMLDPDSNARKQGVLSRYNIEPPSRRNSVVTLPTISNTIGGNMGGNMNATKDRVVPGFSAISSVAQETRFRNAEIYGIG